MDVRLVASDLPTLLADTDSRLRYLRPMQLRSSIMDTPTVDPVRIPGKPLRIEFVLFILQ